MVTKVHNIPSRHGHRQNNQLLCHGKIRYDHRPDLGIVSQFNQVNLKSRENILQNVSTVFVIVIDIKFQSGKDFFKK